MDEYDLYYADGRNAVRRVVRPGGVMRPSPGPSTPVVAQPAPPVMQPAQPAPVFYGGQPMPYGPPPYAAPTYGSPYPTPMYGAPYNPPSYSGPSFPPPYASPYGAPPYPPPYGYAGTAPFYPPPMGGSSQGVLRGLGGMNIGVLASVGLAAYAALRQLPPPPVATNDVGTNVQNLITYQAELAKHGKTDEQIRTAGDLIEKLYPVL